MWLKRLKVLKAKYSNLSMYIGGALISIFEIIHFLGLIIHVIYNKNANLFTAYA